MTTLAEVRKIIEADPSIEFSVNDLRDKLVVRGRNIDRPWISPSAVSQALRLFVAEGSVTRRRGVVGKRSAGPNLPENVDVVGYLYRWVLPPRSGWCDSP